MRVAMIGTGYVGLVSGTCFADFGHHVICVDRDRSKIEALKRGEMPIFEPRLAQLVELNFREGRLPFAGISNCCGIIQAAAPGNRVRSQGAGVVPTMDLDDGLRPTIPSFASPLAEGLIKTKATLGSRILRVGER
jgi:threonine dehydrogenase-like Zn-dependent dehydrogenase